MENTKAPIREDKRLNYLKSVLVMLSLFKESIVGDDNRIYFTNTLTADVDVFTM